MFGFIDLKLIYYLFMKLGKIKKELTEQEFLTLIEKHVWQVKMYFSLFLFLRFFPLESVFFWFSYKLSLIQKISARGDQKKFKSSSKEYVTWTLFNLGQRKIFSEKPTRVWWWLMTKVPRIIVVRDFLPSLFEFNRGISPP